MFLYHATYGCYLESILRDGLLIDQKKNWLDNTIDGIFLSNHALFSKSFCETADADHITDEMVDDIVVLVVKCDDLTLEEDPYLSMGENPEDIRAYVCKQNIPPEKIRLVNDLYHQ